MPASIYQIYQCDNPKCALRFPGYEGYPRWNLCPMCRSRTHVVEIIPAVDVDDSQPKISNRLSVYVLLDNIRSALNVGSIFRTSDGGGVDKIILCGITPTPENTKVHKTALGAENEIKWQQSNNGLNTALNLKKEGFTVWTLENLPESIPLYDISEVSSHLPLVLVVGNEVSGVDPGIIRVSDRVISIPMLGKKSSYNVSIAFGIAISFIFYRSMIIESGKYS